MLKRFYYFSIILAALFLPSFTSYAYSADEIAGQSKFLNFNGSSIVSDPISEDVFWNEYERAVTDILHACDAVEVGGVEYDVLSNGYRFQISAKQLSTLISHQEYADQWAAETLPSIVSQGMDRETAIHSVYNWIVDNYYYSTALTQNQSTLEKYQGVYAMITSSDKGGICASFSKMFRILVEAIPLNENQLVDYQASSPTHINVLLVSNAQITHEWDAIKTPDIGFYYYDLSAQADPTIQSFDYYELTDNTIVLLNFYGTPDSFIFNR